MAPDFTIRYFGNIWRVHQEDPLVLNIGTRNVRPIFSTNGSWDIFSERESSVDITANRPSLRLSPIGADCCQAFKKYRPTLLLS